jgi:hypothetical protein
MAAERRRIPLDIGDIFDGRFEILRLLGSGGMADVFLVRDLILRREVALKARAKAGIGSAALERFRREAAVARDLQHPSLVQSFDIHETPEILALSMEYVPGETLQARLARAGPMPEAEAALLARRLAEALESLHTHDIIHRDVKPSNIFLSGDGTLKLGDFGIVHLEDGADLTRTGQTLGTPTHMSPEQFLGRDLTPASDYYSLGVTLFEALSGSLPFTGTYGELAIKHAEQAPPALAAAGVSSSMRRLVGGLLLKDPARRWGRNEMERFLNGRRLPYLPRQKALGALIVALGMIAAAGALVWGRFRHPEPTSIRVKDGRVSALKDDRLLWERPIPGMTDAILADADGNGSKEVVIGKTLSLKGRQEGIRLDVLGKDGSPAPPIQMEKSFTHYFRGFAPRYQTIFAPVDSRRFAVYFYNANFYPTCAYIWDAPSRRVVFSSMHSGRFYSVVPFGGGVAMEGISNRLLHQKVLLVTQGLGGAASLGFNAVDDINYYYGKGARAYYLLGSEGKTRLDGPNSVAVHVPGEEERLLKPDASLAGMSPGAASRSLDFIEEYRQVRDLLMQGGADRALARLDRLLGDSQKTGLFGDTVLFASLKAEAFLRLGRSDEAARTALAWAEKFPGYGMDLNIQAALGLMMDGKASAAVRILQDVSNDSYGGRREEIRTVLIWAAMLDSAEKGRTALEYEGALIPSGLYWKRYAQMQEGWIRLLENHPEKARELLAPALKMDGMENHAAGYFLARLLDRSFDASEFDAYMKQVQVSPEYLLWLGAAGRHDAAEAARHWMLLKEDAWHTPDSALMLALLNRFKSLHKM